MLAPACPLFGTSPTLTAAGSQRVAAMNMYLASPEFEADFATTTADPVADTDSNCRVEATAALIVWLISVLQ